MCGVNGVAYCKLPTFKMFSDFTVVYYYKTNGKRYPEFSSSNSRPKFDFTKGDVADAYLADPLSTTRREKSVSQHLRYSLMKLCGTYSCYVKFCIKVHKNLRKYL